MIQDRHVQKEILREIDRTADELFAMIQELVRIPSVVGEEGRAQEWVFNLYKTLGLEAVKFVPRKEDLLQHPAYFEIGFPYNESRPNVIGICRGKGNGRSLLLNGHIDVVSPEPLEAWYEGGPWSGKIEGGRLYGRGSADMKSGLLANFFALRTLLILGLKPKGTVLLQSVIEEEAGGCGGTLACLQAGYKADAMIIPEPFDLRIITAHPGIRYFRVKVIGKTAHAGQSHLGVNAIGKLARIYDRLMELDLERAKRHRNPFFEASSGRSCNLNIGTFKAGDWVSTVAGAAQLEARISYLPEETEQSMRREVEEAVSEVVAKDPWLKEHPPVIEWFGWDAKPWTEDPEIPLIRRFEKVASEVLTFTPEIAASHAGLDTRFGPYFAMPSFTFGPRGGLLHTSNEYVDLDSVLQTTKVLAAFMADWCEI